jgi:hypothetical protein
MSRRARHAATVVALALTGLVLAVALAVLTSRLTTQHVGLAGEPLRPKSGLVSRAPAHAAPARDDARSERGDD